MIVEMLSSKRMAEAPLSKPPEPFVNAMDTVQTSSADEVSTSHLESTSAMKFGNQLLNDHRSLSRR